MKQRKHGMQHTETAHEGLSQTESYVIRSYQLYNLCTLVLVEL